VVDNHAVATGTGSEAIDSEEAGMSVQQAVWIAARAPRRRTMRPWSNDLLAVVTLCLIFGLQILVVMQTTGGSGTYGMVASEGMQSP
jgi:hypothetical protein